MSEVVGDIIQGLLEAIEIEKGNIPLIEKKNMPAPTFVIDLETDAKDGRLTEPSDGIKYEWRKMIEEVKRLGSPLTDEETETFKIK